MDMINKNKKTKISKNKNPNSFNMLSCKSNLGKDDPRVSTIKVAIKDENVRNIAIIGPYGSGKSSIIRSYIKTKLLNKKTIYFSMDTLGNYENWKEPSCLRSILYTELLKRNTGSIILNRYFNQLFNGKKQWIMFILFLIISLSISAIATFFLLDYFGYISYCFGAAIFAFLLFVYFSLSLVNVKAQFKSFHGIDIFGEWKKDDCFDSKTIKEHPGYVENVVIKQLSSKHVKYIVFEDLDRSDKANYIELIKELKSFNDLLNQSKEFTFKFKKIIFFYAIKDDEFIDSETRTKYFDLIIPVTPYSTFSNAADSVLRDEYIKESVNRNTIVDLSSYLLDQRQVNAVTTQFNINRHLTYSKDLLSELFALTVFNVRFPSLYSKLFNRNNFLNQLIKDFNANQGIFDSFNVLVAPSNELPSLARIRLCLTEFGKDEKEEFMRFIKTCLMRKYITLNYEMLLHSKVENGLVSSDLQYLHMHLAGEYDRYYEIVNPLALLNHAGNPIIFFNNKHGLNVFFAYFIFNAKEQVTNLKEYKNSVVKTLIAMSNAELADYLNNIPYKSFMVDFYQILIDQCPNLVQLYYAASQIEDNKIKNDICIRLYNSFDENKLDTNKKLPSAYLDFINSVFFLDQCGQLLNPAQTIRMIGAKYLYPASLNNLKINNDVKNALISTSSYVKTFSNLCILFDDFNNKPLKYILKNTVLYDELVSDKDGFIRLLDQCDYKDSKDSIDDCVTFINKLDSSASLDVLNSRYFYQWKHKLPFVAEPSKKYLLVVQKGMVDFSNPLSIDNTIKLIRDDFVSAIQNQIDYFSTITFGKETSWYLVKLLDSSTLKTLKPALSLQNSVNYVSSIGFEKTNVLLTLLEPTEKTNLLKYIMTNNPGFIVDAFIGNYVSKEDLIEVKINPPFLDKVFEKNAKPLLNLCLLNNNLEISKQYMNEHTNYAYGDIFIGDNGEFLSCDDIDIIAKYSISEKRDFDFVRKLITSIPKDKIGTIKTWRLFLESFNIKKENKDKRYLYFENNENNNILIDFFNECGIVRNVKYQNSNSEIRCTI